MARQTIMAQVKACVDNGDKHNSYNAIYLNFV